MHVLRGIQQQTVRWFTVAPGTARLLVIALKVQRHVVVRHEAHVALVYAHTKGAGGNHYGFAVEQEILLIDRTLTGGSPAW